MLACRISAAETIAESAAIRAGLRFGFAWDHFLEQMAVAVKATVRRLVRASTTLLLILFTVDLVWRGGKWATGGAGAAAFMEGLVFRLLAVLFCMAILSAGDAVIGFIADSAGRLARAAGAREVFALQEFAASKLALAFSLFEGAGNTPIIIQVQITLMAVLVVVLAALQMAVVIFWYARLFLAAAAGILVVGFARLSQGMAAARAWLVSLIGAGLSLMVLMLVLNITPTLAWDLRSAADPITTAPAAAAAGTPRAYSDVHAAPHRRQPCQGHAMTPPTRQQHGSCPAGSASSICSPGSGACVVPSRQLAGDACLQPSGIASAARPTASISLSLLTAIISSLKDVRPNATAPEQIPAHDVLLAGFPSQPFSIAGVSKKNALGRPHGFLCDTQGTLFYDLAKIIAHHRPARLSAGKCEESATP